MSGPHQSPSSPWPQAPQVPVFRDLVPMLLKHPWACPPAPAIATISANYEVTALHDRHYPVKTETFMNNHPVKAVFNELANLFLPPTILPTSMVLRVVNTGKNLVLIDAGNGDFLPDIDTMIISYFHVDHVCGMRLMDGTYQFPNAQIYALALEWVHGRDDSNQSRAQASADLL